MAIVCTKVEAPNLFNELQHYSQLDTKNQIKFTLTDWENSSSVHDPLNGGRRASKGPRPFSFCLPHKPCSLIESQRPKPLWWTVVDACLNDANLSWRTACVSQGPILCNGNDSQTASQRYRADTVPGRVPNHNLIVSVHTGLPSNCGESPTHALLAGKITLGH